jgi:very-short-patch-repair endonuclease
MRNRSKDAVAFARDLRKNMSESEQVLWAELRRKNHRFRFRKQHPIGPYVLDFYCPEVLVCVEVDGEQHAERVERDQVRDEWLLRQGILTIRIPSWDVFDDLDSVVEQVIRTCDMRQKEPPPAQG